MKRVLMLLYITLIGVISFAQNEHDLFENYKNSAEKGNIINQYKLAMCYWYGSGTQQNYVKSPDFEELFKQRKGG